MTKNKNYHIYKYNILYHLKCKSYIIAIIILC